ncbi:adenylyl-sulfate kinase [Sphingorhabdus lutea]|uniref:Multifunctional fusion protein n=1 Tax=Sphingorhabdus lutea TaxID=1913578 RepID=A0A1L3JF30_9SPHN|nr:sulfate adenylyltransferase subunit CysN [Sphingorhabdus lutea]APG63747.1 adenylyl-sulfate kinase [Sphingorhabdus lutea]
MAQHPSFKPDDLIAQDIDQYLQLHQSKQLLRFITCGSVDDGKSTLIGRMLYDCKMIFDDQLASLESDSKKVGTQGGDIDFALLVDGLAAEREQGITIDVAYRFFSTEKRKFIVADTPGHEQYTRNMVTGASTADLAILLVDARKSILPQTRRHSFLAHLLGIKNILLAVNKIDLMDYSQEIFDNIAAEFGAYAGQIGIENFDAIPLSALKGDNIIAPSPNMPWYDGPNLISYLEHCPIAGDVDNADNNKEDDFTMPVQWVNRPNLDFRGFSGQISSGTVHKGSEIRIVASGKRSKVKSIITFDGELQSAAKGQSITLTLEDEIDASRGDIIAIADAPPQMASQFETTIFWMDETAMLPGRAYAMKLASQSCTATLQPPKYKYDINNASKLAAKDMSLNDIAVCTLSTDRDICFESYADNRDLGGFILIDRATNATVAAGTINFALRRSQNIHWQNIDVDKAAHAQQKGQRPRLLWFTGLSGSGKSTIANLVEKQLYDRGKHSFLLDGDNVRHGLNRDLGFTDKDRVENIRRIAEVGKLMTDAGLIVLTAFISPFRAEREMARKMMPEGEFIEIFIDTSIKVAEQRDVKGLYKKARAGELKNFTGIDSPYEKPENPEIYIDTAKLSSEDAANLIVETILK